MRLSLLIAASLMLAWAGEASAQDAPRKTPYWASIASGKAMMRSGPGRNYPGLWLYQRRDLPVKVVKVYENWRQIEDPDGERGWMLVSLLASRRTGMVKPGQPRDIRVKPSLDADVRYRVEAGVVGRLEACDGRFCKIKIGDKEGWIEQTGLDGVTMGETFEE